MIFLNFENIINIFTSTKYDSFYLFWKLIAIHSYIETALCDSTEIYTPQF